MKGNKTILTENSSPLGIWAKEALGLPEVQVQVRLRGNHLHILCEAEKCPEMSFALAQFSQALSQINIESLLPPNQPRIYQTFLCGRTLGRRRPDWTVKLDSNKVRAQSGRLNSPILSNDSETNFDPTSTSTASTPQEYSQNYHGTEGLPEEKFTKIGVGQSSELDIHRDVASELLLAPDQDFVGSNDTLDNLNFLSPKFDSETFSSTEPEKSKLKTQLDKLKESDINLINSSLTVSSKRLAKYGHPDAIASYLSEILGELGVCVNVSVREKQFKEKLTETSSQLEDVTKNFKLKTQKILWVSCEATYSPDPSLLAEPITQKLRDLKLKDFHEALISLLVRGETAPDWMLRVDLTPPDLMLQEWASWGDVTAIERLLKQKLATLGVDIRGILKESTLHLFCTSTNNSSQEYPDQQKTKAAIASILATIIPRGIQAATIYGCTVNESNYKRKEFPRWIDWLNLPASENQDLSASAEVLASQGNYEAISFLLNRLVNSNLDQRLKTGGIRVLILSKQELLHVMSEAPTSPSQSQVGPCIANFLRQLQIPGVSGVRVYGRRAGQKLPLWRYGINFTTKNRRYSEKPPEFAATAEMDFLLGKRADRAFLKLAPKMTEKSDSSLLYFHGYTLFKGRLLTGIQQLLIGSRLFIPNEEDLTKISNSLTYNSRSYGKWFAAISYAALGILLTVQTDLKVDEILKKVPDVSLYGNICQGRNCQTQSEEIVDENQASGLMNYPSFNSPQLDEQLLRYQQYLEAEKKIPDILIVGSSRALRGVDPTVLAESLAALGYPNFRIYNFGVNGATAQVVDLIVRQVLPPEQLPKLIIFADGVRALNSGRVDRTFDIIAGSEGYDQVDAGSFIIGNNRSDSSVNYDLNKYKQILKKLESKVKKISVTYQQRDRLKRLIVSIIKNPTNFDFLSGEGNQDLVKDHNLELEQFQANGFLPISIKFKPESYYQNYTKVSGDYDADYAEFQLRGKQTTALKKLLQYTQSIGVNFVFVNMPLTIVYLDEVRTVYEQEFQEYMQQLSGEYTNFIFRDLGSAWPETYDNFSDPSHLNLYGAIAVSQTLADDHIIPWRKR
ncbi:hypothetical protein Tery_4157 [Trichodesmium erythraeum IMS101]|uniref:DUF1574 domain-containing protein n=1 Tax=Trichodesmium erythraeum (strain IMS101) TaxID=203124 RepID=Q10X60_TRIEI|nr:DUF1574 family protein [Trichodesmium erythraeum GBRTRLIN201]